MSQVRFQAIDVKTDLGVQEGCLALVDDVLLAVFVRVGTEETRSMVMPAKAGSAKRASGRAATSTHHDREFSVR